MEEIPGMKNAFPLLDEFYRKPEYNQGDSSKYNIPNRFYPNEEPIPVNLPPTYNLPKIQNQKCANCIFLGETKCNKWKAKVRSKYWCKSWKMIPIDMEVEFENYMNKIMAQKEKDKARSLANDLSQTPKTPDQKLLEEIKKLEREKLKEEKIQGTKKYILSGENRKWLRKTRKKARKNDRTIDDQAYREAKYVVDQSGEFD